MDYGKLLAQRRDEWTLDALLKRESRVKNSPITILHQRAQEGLTVLPRDHTVETGSDNPLNWTLANHLDRWAPEWSRRVGEYPHPRHGIACATEYWECLQNNRPMCHMVRQVFDRADRHYVRLLIPHEGRIVYAFRSLVPVVTPGSVPVKRPRELRQAFPGMADSIRGSTEH